VWRRISLIEDLLDLMEKPLKTIQAEKIPAPTWAWTLARAGVIIAVGIWIFWPALWGGWIWDDFPYIPQNTLNGDPARLWKIWFAPGSFIEYYPIEQTVLWAQWEIFRHNTLGYHITNLALHLLSSLLVWRLLAKFNLHLAWLGGLLFAIHPTAIESVAWMSELKNSLSLPPFLLAVCAYIDYDERGRKSDYFLSLGLFLVAMLCKISMAPFPVIILLFAWWKRGRIGWRDIKSATPFFVISLVLGLLTIMAGIWFRQTHHMVADQIQVGGLLSRLDLMGLLSAWYFYQVACPVTHSFLYAKWPVNPPSASQFFPWLLFAVAFYFLWTQRKSWGRHALLGLGFFFISLAPFLGLTTPSYMQYTWAMDHMLYLPIIGLIGLAIAGLDQLARHISEKVRPWSMILIALLMSSLTFASHLYAATFVDETTLWAHSVECVPNSVAARESLGLAFARQKQFEKAIVQFREAARLSPTQDDIPNNLGLSLVQIGQLQEAMNEFDTAIRLNPDSICAYGNRGHLWQMLGDLKKSDADLARAMVLTPDLPEPYLNRGANRQAEGDWQGQVSDLQAYCQRAPWSPNVDYTHFEIYTVLATHGQRMEAVRQLTLAMQPAWNNPDRGWRSQIAGFLLGHISEDAFIASAAASNLDQERLQRCEAYYFAGMMRLANGDKKGAVDLFHKSMGTGDTQAVAYLRAQVQLGHLK
jgi:tetratricopeptide (TPR) repeat protein